MKKTFFTALVAVFVMSSISAQTFGAKAGLNLTNYIGSDAGETAAKIGANVGAFARFKISDEFTFQPELVFSMQGAQDKNDSKIKLNANYLNVPLMAKYEVANGFRLVAGPQVGFLMSAKGTDGDISIDLKDEFKSIDFSLGLGAEYELESGLFFDWRYNFGLNTVDDSGDEDVKNAVMQIGLGYSFN